MIHKGITDSVFTLYSELKVWDIIDRITEIKCNAAFKWLTSLDLEIQESVVVGTYLTGLKMAEMLNEISNVVVVDIHPYLEALLGDIEFSVNLYKIKDVDLVVDTTGLGGLNPEDVKKFVNSDIFLVEDPTSSASDSFIRKKGNILERLKSASSSHKGILKTYGLDAKTSGTMTLTLEVLRRSLDDVLKLEGVLYGVAAMDFYEGILFREKNVEKFLKYTKKPALIVSTLQPISCDDVIERNIKKIESTVEIC